MKTVYFVNEETLKLKSKEVPMIYVLKSNERLYKDEAVRCYLVKLSQEIVSMRKDLKNKETIYNHISNDYYNGVLK